MKPIEQKVDDKKEDKKDNKQENKKEENKTPKYSNEWVDGKWYDAEGNQKYAGTLSWKSDIDFHKKLSKLPTCHN